MFAFLRPDRLTGMVGGFLLWSVYFVAVYGLQAIGCKYGWNRVELGTLNTLSLLLATLTLLTLVAIAGVAYGGYRCWAAGGQTRSIRWSEDRHRFMGLATLLIAMLSAVATVWVGLGVFLLPPCEGL